MNPLLSHALIGLACLLLGACVGFSIRDRTKVKYQLVQNVAVAVISLLAMTGLFVATNNNQEQARCQSQYNKSFTTALKERAEATDADRTALQKALGAILDPASTIESRTRALQEWKTTVDEANKKRTENPLPLPPECIEDTP